jgi:nucleotide-binding universal stress UspA family protein
MFERILVPTDGSAGAENAVATALGLAELFDATVHALYVIDKNELTEFAETLPMTTEDIEGTRRKQGEKAVQEIADLASERGLRAVTDVMKGRPARVILDYTRDNELDLVVMGTHGRTGVGRYTAGSVTERVVRMSRTPVLTVRWGEAPEPPEMEEIFD